MMKKDIEWRNVVGLEGFYEVSNFGDIRNAITKAILKPSCKKNGYKHIELRYGVNKHKLVHRIVAEAFIPNYNNYPCVNHKDENKHNNCVENLEWCTSQYNATYGKCKTIKNSPVIQLNMDGEEIARWKSIKEAAESLGIKYQGISRVCRGLRKRCGGFAWKYAEGNKWNTD